jgi:hypothetical protein
MCDNRLIIVAFCLKIVDRDRDLDRQFLADKMDFLEKVSFPSVTLMKHCGLASVAAYRCRSDE